MEYRTGSIWDFLPSHTIVVGTNVGWDEQADPPMRNNMGDGLASQARDRFPRLSWWYGLLCCRWSLEHLEPCQEWLHPQLYKDPRSSSQLLLAAVKPMVADPSLSWDQEADPAWVNNAFRWIRENWRGGPLAVPLIGAGCGKLDPKLVLGMLQNQLGSLPSVVVVDPKLGPLGVCR